MELKRNLYNCRRPPSILLIVPYGIETRDAIAPTELPHPLLIVPYGIETLRCCQHLPEIHLLIVPYGIETVLS